MVLVVLLVFRLLLFGVISGSVIESGRSVMIRISVVMMVIMMCQVWVSIYLDDVIGFVFVGCF